LSEIQSTAYAHNTYIREALTLLLERIKSIPNDDANSQHKGRLQQKVANAAQTYLVNIALIDCKKPG
jgi:hypothetical protein